MQSQQQRLEKLRNAYVFSPDFPKKGINFLDIMPIFASPQILHVAIDAFEFALSGLEFDKIAGLEARGFLFGVALAYKMNKPFFPIRKKGKMGGPVHRVDYDLEYGSDTVEMQKAAIKEGERVVLLDDVLATGGTMAAAVKLVKLSGGLVVKIAVLADIPKLGGQEKLGDDASKVVSLTHLQ